MSTLICELGKCTFTRINTNGPALNPFTQPPVAYPAYYDANRILEEVNTTTTTTTTNQEAVEDVLFKGLDYTHRRLRAGPVIETPIPTPVPTTMRTAMPVTSIAPVTPAPSTSSPVTLAPVENIVGAPSTAPVAATMAPSDMPSDFGSDYPSDYPSDVKSDYPSDYPSDVQSDYPSDMQSDFPSSGPIVDTTIAPWTDPANQDFLSDTVAITRDYREGIFNALVPEDNYNKYSAPSGTLWARLPEGQTFEESRCNLNFGYWSETFFMDNPMDMIGTPGVVYLTEEDVYYNIMFTNWTSDTLEGAFNVDMNGDIEQDPTLYRRENPLGGGFQYIRDEVPFSTADLPDCPVCSDATTNPSVITGPLDDTFVEVTLEGITPENATVTILNVRQDDDPKCNSVRQSTASVEANARLMNDTTTVMLRRTHALGQLNPFWYTIYFSAETEAGLCRGSTRICVPRPGFTCEDRFDVYDAFTQRTCLP